MASKKKESEGIALLSVYYDEEEEEEDEDMEERRREEEEDLGTSERVSSDEAAIMPPTRLLQSQSSLSAEDLGGAVAGVGRNRSISSLMSQFGDLDASRVSSRVSDVHQNSKKGTLGIVDYEHDEMAMSPEAEDGEIVRDGDAGADLQSFEGNPHERTPPGTVQILTPNVHVTPRPSEQAEPPQCDNNTTMDCTMEIETHEADDAVVNSVGEPKEVDPLGKFLPPPPKARCSEELQDKINKFLSFQRAGKSYNAEVRNRKDYRNPDFLQRAVTYQEIDQIGSCFSKDVFDPRGYDRSDFYDEIEADLKREMERREQEKKRSGKVEFVSGGSQSGMAMAPKIALPIAAGQTVAISGFHSAPGLTDAAVRDSRQSKKSKWDKVDGERKNPLHPGQDAMSTAASHAALLSAANAGAGYSAFVQQRRREAEEKRSSERKRS
ncbi:hypothetical protein Sjap_000539 [Stephania japonica]|uniref:SAP30-binding protein n=1 Tax=Stephania japonica TaxID=461633 RepID=A0AAP0KKG2_9MAGN